MNNQSNVFVPIANTRRPYKLYIKRNNKKILNPRIIKALKKDFNKVALPTKFAWDKKNKKIINLYSGSSNNTSVEFKKISKADRKNLQYYGNTIYDRNANKLVNKKKIFKKDGTLREQYKDYKILKSNQIPTTKTAVKDKFFSFTYTHEVQFKDYTTKTGEQKSGEIQTRSKQFTYTGKTNWTKAKVAQKEKELIKDYEKELMADSPLKRTSGGSSSGSSGISGGSMGGGYTFNLNSSLYLTMDGEGKQEWNTKTNKCVYDWIINRYGNIKGCKKICNVKTLFYIFNNNQLAPQSIRADQQGIIEQFFNKHFLTETQFNNKMLSSKDPYSNYLCYDILGGAYGAGELLELIKEEDKPKVYETYSDFTKMFWGVSPSKINNFCKYLQIPHYCIDNEDELIHYYYPEERNTTKKIPTMVYKSSGGHIHPITDPSTVKSLAQLLSDNTKHIKKDNKDGKKKKKATEIIEVINCKDRIAYLIDLMNETATQVISDKVKVCGDDITSFVLEDKKYIFIDTDETDPTNYAKTYCELNNIEYYGQSLTSIAMVMLKEKVKVKSECNHIVNNILHTDKIKFRTHLGFMNGKDYTALNENNNIKAYDISKCYSKCITEPINKFISFDFNALPQVFTPQHTIVNGLYYVETEDTTLYHGSNMYSKSIVDYGLLNNIITKNNIKWYIPASNTHSKDLFKELFKEYKFNSKDNVELNKRLNNYTTGLVGISKHKKTKFSCSTELNDAFNYLLEYKNNKCYLRQHNGICVYGNKVSVNLEQHNIPIYIQILDDSNIRLYELMKEATNNKIYNVIYRKTDCVVVENPNPNINVGELWGEYRQEGIPQKTITCDYKERIPKIDTPAFTFNYQYVDITDSSDYKQIQTLLRCNKGLMVNGSAGTGKSFVIKNISKDIGNDKVARLCFTNKGAININGQTIHRFLGLDKNGDIAQSNINNIANTIELIIIDEVSMVSSFLWARLYTLYQQTKIPFLLVGDWKQIPPVESLKPFDYLQHPAVVSLSGGKICELEKVYRYCDKLKQASNNVMGLDTSKFGSSITKKNVCYYNKTRKFVNSLVVGEMLKSGKITEVREVKQEEYKKSAKETNNEFKQRCNKNPTQDIHIFKGMPLIASSTIEQGNVAVNNEEFILTGFKGENITAESERPDGKHTITIPLKEFYHVFLVSYCITTHKAQGSTIKGNMTLWDWEQMDVKLRYTAITRATGYDKINFCKI